MFTNGRDPHAAAVLGSDHCHVAVGRAPPRVRAALDAHHVCHLQHPPGITYKYLFIQNSVVRKMWNSDEFSHESVP